MGFFTRFFCLDDHHFRDFSHVFFSISLDFWADFVRPCVSAFSWGAPSCPIFHCGNRAGGRGGLFGAAKNGNLPALRHFLRADPRSGVHKKQPSDGRWPQPRVVLVTWCCVPEDDPKLQLGWWWKVGWRCQKMIQKFWSLVLREIWTSQLLVYIFCDLNFADYYKKFAEVIRGKSQMEQRGNKNEQKAMR